MTVNHIKREIQKMMKKKRNQSQLIGELRKRNLNRRRVDFWKRMGLP